MVKFADLLNRQANIYRPTWSAVDEHGDRIVTYELYLAQVPTRREPSEATDNILLNIGGGQQLRSQMIWWFMPTVDILKDDRLELLANANDPSGLVEVGTWEVLAVELFDHFNYPHHKMIESHRIFS